MCLAGEESVDALAESFNAHASALSFDDTVVINESECWLATNAVFLPDNQVLIGNVSKPANIEGGDEILNRLQIVPTGNTDHPHIVTVLSLHLCDRRGF